MMAGSTRSNQRPDTLMQDRIARIEETSCTARPPIEDRAALGDILDRDLTSGGGRWLHSLITGEKVGYGLITGP